MASWRPGKILVTIIDNVTAKLWFIPAPQAGELNHVVCGGCLQTMAKVGDSCFQEKERVREAGWSQAKIWASLKLPLCILGVQEQIEHHPSLHSAEIWVFTSPSVPWSCPGCLWAQIKGNTEPVVKRRQTVSCNIYRGGLRARLCLNPPPPCCTSLSLPQFPHLQMRGSENASLRTAVRMEGGSTCKGLGQLLAHDEDAAGARTTGTFNVLELPRKCGNCPPSVPPLCQAQTIFRAEEEALP